MKKVLKFCACTEDQNGQMLREGQAGHRTSIELA